MNPSRRNPLLFLTFFTANSLLSYFSLSLEARLWVGLVGLLVPAGLWLAKSPDKARAGKPMDQLEFLPAIPVWGWMLVAVLALAARFAGLTSLYVWPNFDESAYGFEALQLADQGHPHFFYGVSQAPPFFIWGLAFFFKFFGVSMDSLRIFPALISLSAVPLAYLSARAFFSKSYSFLCMVLVAVSFWPVFVGRFALMTILILPAQCLALWLWGRLVKASNFETQKKAAAWLGLGLGLGFYTHLHWPVVLVLIALPATIWALDLFKKHPDRAKTLVVRAGIAGTVVVLPLAFAAWQSHYGGYLYHLWAFKSSFSLSTQLPIWLSCLTSPFWGMDPNVRTYQPQWGGFLNPVLASLFFLGVLEMLRHWRRPLYLWLILGFAFCLLPGLLTQDQETFRLFPMVPLLLVGALVGWSGLLSPSRPRQNLFWLLLFLPSMALDANHLFGAYHHIWDKPADWGYYTKSLGRYRAFPLLEDRSRRQGPGLLFLDFVQGLPDQSLTVATYGYNATLNPRLDPGQARWAGLLANVNYLPFLKKRFPDAQAYPLSQDMPGADGGWMLFLFPLTPPRLGELRAWCEAARDLEPFVDKDLCYVMGRPFDDLLVELAKTQGAFGADPFLRASFFEKKSDLEIKQGLPRIGQEGGFPAEKDPAIQSLEKAVTEGYPAAHLYEHLGVLWLMHGDSSEAAVFFRKAAQAPLNLTDAAQYLDSLKPPGAGKAAP